MNAAIIFLGLLICVSVIYIGFNILKDANNLEVVEKTDQYIIIKYKKLPDPSEILDLIKYWLPNVDLNKLKIKIDKGNKTILITFQ